MITIKTSNSRILDAAGNGVSGTIVIRPSEPFEFDEGGERIKVARVPIRQRFENGQLSAPFPLAPTQGAGHAPATGLYYIVDFVDFVPGETGLSWREHWQLNGSAGAPTEYEITAVPLVTIDPDTGKPIDDTGWIDAPLLNSWQGIAGQEPGYRRLRQVVYLRGVLEQQTGAPGTVAFQLPEGLRPERAMSFEGARVAKDPKDHIWVTVAPSGEVTLSLDDNQLKGDVSLASICFIADQ